MLPRVCVWRLPRWLSGKESACQCRRCGFNPWVWKIPWSRKWQPTPVFLPGKFHGQRSLVDYSPWSCRVGQDWATPHTRVCALPLSIPQSPLFAVLLCPAYCWPPNLWYRLAFLTRPLFVSWCDAPDLPLITISIIIRHIGLSKDRLPLLKMVKSWWSLASSFPRDSEQSLRECVT